MAIADLAGGEWPDQARRPAVALSGSSGAAPDSVREQLLADIRETFGESGAERLLTEDLLQDRRSREDRLWGERRNGLCFSASRHRRFSCSIHQSMCCARILGGNEPLPRTA